jgi:hypothetical protein
LDLNSGAALAGRPGKRIIAAACLGFPAVFRFFVDIATLTPRIHAGDVWDKSLKKWYLLPLKGLSTCELAAGRKCIRTFRVHRF